jgi:hypothetical protein
MIFSKRVSVHNLSIPPKTTISLSNIAEVEVIQQGELKIFSILRLSMNSDNQLQFYPFVLVHHGRKHIFATSLQKDRDEWVHIVQSQMSTPTPLKYISTMPETNQLSETDAESSEVGTVVDFNEDPTINSKAIKSSIILGRIQKPNVCNHLRAQSHGLMEALVRILQFLLSLRALKTLLTFFKSRYVKRKS